MLAAITAVLLLAQAGELQVPHGKDETSLVKLKAEPLTYVGKEVIICGGANLSDYFNFGYRDNKLTHYSLRFRELGEETDDWGEDACLYLNRDKGSEITKELIETAEKAKGKNVFRILRAKVVLRPEKFADGQQWDMLELLDVQFSLTGSDPLEWQAWVLEARNAKEREQEERIAQRNAAATAEQEAQAEAARQAKLPKIREWSDASGRFRIQAKFGGLVGDTVKLLKQDGTTAIVAIDKLSDADHEYIRSRSR